MRNAEKHLTQGRIEAAIKEYRQIVRNEPNDINSQNMLGDLYAKAHVTDDAVACYRRVAHHYHKQGFAKKAIAVYNKIHKLKPDSVEVLERLAELYQARGSVAEAKQLLVSLADRFEAEDRRGKLLEIWEKLAELDPTDPGICLKIAENYEKRNFKDDACRSYFEAGGRLAERDDHDAASDAFRRALAVNPEYWKAARGLVRSRMLAGEPEEAISVLEEKLESDPHNRECTYLLIDCYMDMDDPESAERIITRLVEREPANYPKLVELAEVYQEREDTDSAVRILSMTYEHLLVGGDADALHGLLTRVLAVDPENVSSLRMLARCYGWQRDQTRLKETLSELALAARKSGEAEAEHFALSQFLHIAPHDTEKAARLEELDEEYDFSSDESENEWLVRPEHESSSDDTGDISEDESGHALSSEEQFAAANEGDLSSFSVNGSQQAGPSEAEQDIVSGPGVVTVIEDSAGQAGPSSSVPGPEGAIVDTPLGPKDEIRFEEEIESIRFYLDQGYEGLAAKALAALEVEFGNRAEIAELRSSVSSDAYVVENGSAPAVVDASASSGPDDREAEVASVEASEPEQEADPTSDPLGEIRDELRMEEAAEADGVDFETHYQTAVAFKEIGMVEQAIGEFQKAVECADAAGSAESYFNCCTLLGHCFVETSMHNLALMWFERAFESPNLTKDEELALTFEIGAVHEMSGDPDKAIDCYEMVYAVDVDYRDVGSRLKSLKEKAGALA